MIIELLRKLKCKLFFCCKSKCSLNEVEDIVEDILEDIDEDIDEFIDEVFLPTQRKVSTQV